MQAVAETVQIIVRHLGRYIVFASGNGISFGKQFNAIFTADITTLCVFTVQTNR